MDADSTPPERHGASHAGGSRADPLRADCPVACLAGLVSAKAFHPLRRTLAAPGQPTSTVGDVVAMLEQGKLGEIPGLGPRRIGEISLCLALAGLTGGPTGHRHCP